jgi:ATP-binding cassette subfamily B protein
VAAAAATAVAGAALRSLSSLAEEAQAQAVTDHVQDTLHAQSVRVDLAYYENPEYFDRLHRAQQEAPLRPPLILGALLRLARSAAFLLAVGGLLLFSMQRFFFVALLVTSVPAVLLRLRHAGALYRWHRRRTPIERRILYLNWLLTGAWHAKGCASSASGHCWRGAPGRCAGSTAASGWLWPAGGPPSTRAPMYGSPSSSSGPSACLSPGQRPAP